MQRPGVRDSFYVGYLAYIETPLIGLEGRLCRLHSLHFFDPENSYCGSLRSLGQPCPSFAPNRLLDGLQAKRSNLDSFVETPFSANSPPLVIAPRPVFAEISNTIAFHFITVPIAKSKKERVRVRNNSKSEKQWQYTEPCFFIIDSFKTKFSNIPENRTT